MFNAAKIVFKQTFIMLFGNPEKYNNSAKMQWLLKLAEEAQI